VLPSAALVAALMAVTMNNRNGACYGAILFPALLLNSLFFCTLRTIIGKTIEKL
jgi:hypothetical protein